MVKIIYDIDYNEENKYVCWVEIIFNKLIRNKVCGNILK